MDPNSGQKQTQTRSTATKKKSNTKETFKEKETPPPDELSLEKSSSLHPSMKDDSTPAASCESLQPYPLEDDDIDPEDLPPVDWKDYADALPPKLQDPAKFETEAQEIASEFSEWELQEQFNQCMRQDDPEAALWDWALEIKPAEEGVCQQ